MPSPVSPKNLEALKTNIWHHSGSIHLFVGSVSWSDGWKDAAAVYLPFSSWHKVTVVVREVFEVQKALLHVRLTHIWLSAGKL